MPVEAMAAVTGTATMEITVSKSELLRELTATQGVVERKTTIPILSNYLFEAVGDKLMLTAGTKILRTNYTGVEFEPSARLLWTPTNRRTFWASFTHALRTPSDAERDFYLSSLIGAAPDGTPLFARFNANRPVFPVAIKVQSASRCRRSCAQSASSPFLASCPAHRSFMYGYSPS